MEAGANIDAMLDEFLSGEFENKAVFKNGPTVRYKVSWNKKPFL